MDTIGQAHISWEDAFSTVSIKHCIFTSDLHIRDFSRAFHLRQRALIVHALTLRLVSICRVSIAIIAIELLRWAMALVSLLATDWLSDWLTLTYSPTTKRIHQLIAHVPTIHLANIITRLNMISDRMSLVRRVRDLAILGCVWFVLWNYVCCGAATTFTIAALSGTDHKAWSHTSG